MGPSSAAVPWVVATDATATTGRLGLQRHPGGNFLLGLDHSYDKCAVLSVKHNPDHGNFQEDGSINGFSAVSQLEEDDQIQRASLGNILMIVPLVQDSFHYGLLTFPVGSFLTHKSLYEVFTRICQVAKSVGIDNWPYVKNEFYSKTESILKN